MVSADHNMHIKMKKPEITYASESKFEAAVMASSSVLILIGIFLQPGPLRMSSSWRRAFSTISERHRSILVTTTNTGTLRAIAYPKCSFVVPAGNIKHFKIYNRTGITYRLIVVLRYSVTLIK